MAAVTPPRPLAETDDRNLFDCGRESLNNWFRRHAWANHIADISRVSVMADAASGRIIGYATLSAAQIERAFLPKPQQRNRPDPVPATLLGQLAVDKAFQGQGHAASLLLFALKTALRAAEIIGSMRSAQSL
jgi:predicted N-acetyltransferase YhbS